MANLQRTTLNRGWVLKTGLFTAVLLVFGSWGLADALYFYPARGLKDASVQFSNWLVALEKAGRLSTTNLAVPDPKSALVELRAKEKELVAQSTGDTAEARKAAGDLAKLAWLESLNRAWRLDAQPKPLADAGKSPAVRRYTFEPKTGQGFSTNLSGAERQEEQPKPLSDVLAAHWNTTKRPTPLSALDMIFQWIFVVVGFGGGAWLVVVMMRAAATSRQFTFDPDAKRLTLPSGASVVPSDLTDVDKRLWHKFFVTLVTRDGKQHKLDLLRYAPLEDWVLDLERTAFPDRAEKPAETAQSAEAAAASGENSSSGNP